MLLYVRTAFASIDHKQDCYLLQAKIQSMIKNVLNKE